MLAPRSTSTSIFANSTTMLQFCSSYCLALAASMPTAALFAGNWPCSTRCRPGLAVVRRKVDFHAHLSTTSYLRGTNNNKPNQPPLRCLGILENQLPNVVIMAFSSRLSMAKNAREICFALRSISIACDAQSWTPAHGCPLSLSLLPRTVHDQRRGKQVPNDSLPIIGFLFIFLSAFSLYFFVFSAEFSSAFQHTPGPQPVIRASSALWRAAQPAHGDSAPLITYPTIRPSHLTGPGLRITLAPAIASGDLLLQIE